MTVTASTDEMLLLLGVGSENSEKLWQAKPKKLTTFQAGDDEVEGMKRPPFVLRICIEC